MIKYKISIITVVKNDEKNIEKTIKSVLNQTYKNYEHIVVDGKSNDKTFEIVKKYKKVKLISKKDKNLWDALNTGIKNSKGEIIGILNSNDFFYKNALKIVNKYFNKNNIDFLFGTVKKDRLFWKFEPKKIYYRFNIYPSHSIGFFIKSEKQKKLGFYNINYNICSDYDLFYRMIVKKKMIGTNTRKNEVLGKFDMNGLSSKINILSFYYQEIKIRYDNGQNFLFLILLLIIKILNFLRNKFIKLF
jgi:glycosyltransferase involved in cell wall biosynthesis